MKVRSGGGYTSNKLVDKKAGWKQEPRAEKANPAGVNQMGLSVQFKREPVIQGKGYEPKQMPKTGVPGYFNSAKQGPGSGRTIYPHAAQSQYGPSAPSAVNRAPDPPATGTRGHDILKDYGSEIKRR